MTTDTRHDPRGWTGLCQRCNRLKYVSATTDKRGHHLTFELDNGEPHDCERQDAPAPTVKRVTLWGDVEDTHQTETELNGWREQQGKLL